MLVSMTLPATVRFKLCDIVTGNASPHMQLMSLRATDTVVPEFFQRGEMVQAGVCIWLLGKLIGHNIKLCQFDVMISEGTPK